MPACSRWRRSCAAPAAEAPAPGGGAPTAAGGDFDAEAELLERQLAQLPGREARLRHLLPLLAPNRHHGAAGLLATRLFSRLFN